MGEASAGGDAVSVFRRIAEPHTWWLCAGVATGYLAGRLAAWGSWGWACACFLLAFAISASLSNCVADAKVISYARGVADGSRSDQCPASMDHEQCELLDGHDGKHRIGVGTVDEFAWGSNLMQETQERTQREVAP